MLAPVMNTTMKNEGNVEVMNRPERPYIEHFSGRTLSTSSVPTDQVR